VSIYTFKPRFQAWLRPFVDRLYHLGVTANQVTLFTCAVSIIIGLLVLRGHQQYYFLLIPVWMFIRMALNAIDGMLAREYAQQSALGAYLNELTDVISDSLLYLPFAYLGSHSTLGLSVGIFIVAAVLVEMTGCVGLLAQASRRYDGPFGKSDRAFAIGLLSLIIGCGVNTVLYLPMIFDFFSLLCAWTMVRRVQQGLAEIKKIQP
jgi:CDP-diacylglycerol--glycerol-3-phosphate 3-phosphatidyltransferase